MKIHIFFFISFTYALAANPNCTIISIKNGDTCYKLWTDNGMTQDNFNSANPSINCQNLQAGQTVCIIPDPLLPGQYRDDPNSSTCRKTYSIKAGDTCQALWSTNALNESAFMTSNPGINCRNLQIGQKVCLNGYLPDTSSQQYNPYSTTTTDRINSNTQPSYTTPSPNYNPYSGTNPTFGGNVQSNNPTAQSSPLYIPPAQYQQSQNNPQTSQPYSQTQSSSYQSAQYDQVQTRPQGQQSQSVQYQPQVQQIQTQPKQQQTFYQPQQSQYQPQNQQSQYQATTQQAQQAQYQPQIKQAYNQPQAQQAQYQPQTQQAQYQPQTQQAQYQPQTQQAQYQPQTQQAQYQPQTQQVQYQPQTQQAYNQPQTQQVYYQPQAQQTQYQPQASQTQYQTQPAQYQYSPPNAQAQPATQNFQYGAPITQFQPSYQPLVGQNMPNQAFRPLYDSSMDTTVNETCRIHTIKLGDTCFDIWSANGMTQSEFARLNPSVNCQTLQLGQKVCTDPNALRPGQFRDDASCQKLYSIKAGDTCINLWQTYGMSQQQFMQRNPGINCQNLQIGQDICLS